MAKSLLTDNFSEPLNGATAAEVEINCGIGNLTIDRLTGDEQMLAGGMLQYLENQGKPIRSVSSDNGRATFRVRVGGTARQGFRFPWQACAGGAYEWRIHLNSAVSSDITAHSDGGNIRLNLAGMAVTRVSADTGGGNVDVVLPDNAADVSVAARSGAGNVTVEIGSGTRGTGIVNAHSGAGNVVVGIPSGIAARVHARSGLGKTIVDPRFSKTDKDTYESPDYDSAANRLDITINSGAGNVSVGTR